MTDINSKAMCSMMNEEWNFLSYNVKLIITTFNLSFFAKLEKKLAFSIMLFCFEGFDTVTEQNISAVSTVRCLKVKKRGESFLVWQRPPHHVDQN